MVMSDDHPPVVGLCALLFVSRRIPSQRREPNKVKEMEKYLVVYQEEKRKETGHSEHFQITPSFRESSSDKSLGTER